MSHSSCWCHSSPLSFIPLALCAWHLKMLMAYASPANSYLVYSSVFVAWTFFLWLCGSGSLNLMCRLTWRAKSECRGLAPGVMEPGLCCWPCSVLILRRTERRGVCGGLCGRLKPGSSIFWKITKGLKPDCDTHSRAEVGGGAIPAYALSLLRSPFPGSCYRCLRWPSGSHFWGSQLLNFESLPACVSACPCLVCLLSCAYDFLFPPLPSDPPGTHLDSVQKNCCNPLHSSSVWLKEVEIKREKWWFKK